MAMDTEFIIINSGFYDYDLSKYLELIQHAYIKCFIGGNKPQTHKILWIVCRQHRQEQVNTEIQNAFPFKDEGYPHFNWEDTQILISRDHDEKFSAFLNIEPSIEGVN